MQNLVNYFRGAKLWSDLIAVYQEHGNKKVIKAIIRTAAGTPLPKLREEIEGELKAILDKLETEAKEIAERHNEIKAELSQSLTKQLVTTSRAELIKRRNMLWSQAKYQHAKLSALTSDEARAQAVANLKRIWAQLDYTWLELDTFDATGQFLDTQYLVNYQQMDTAQLYAALYRLRPQRSKARKQLKAANTNDETLKLKSKLVSFDSAIETIILLIQIKRLTIQST